MKHNQALLFRNNGELLFVEILHFKKFFVFLLFILTESHKILFYF